MGILFSWGLWRFVSRPWIAVAVQAVISIWFVILWHPRHAEKFPEPIASMLRRSDEREAYLLENDMRFKEVIKLIEWGYNSIIDDANGRENVLGVATRWPITEALREPSFGYIPEGLPIHHANSWAEVDATKVSYVFYIEPMSHYGWHIPEDNFGGIWQVARRDRYGLTAYLYKVRPLETPGK